MDYKKLSKISDSVRTNKNGIPFGPAVERHFKPIEVSIEWQRLNWMEVIIKSDDKNLILDKCKSLLPENSNVEMFLKEDVMHYLDSDDGGDEVYYRLYLVNSTSYEHYNEFVKDRKKRGFEKI